MKKALALFLALVTTFQLAACGGGKQPAASGAASSAEQQTVDVDLTQKEAPEFAEQVAAGTLPALEERIPVADDVMIESVEELGNYGGSITITTLDNGRWNWGPFTEQSLFRFKDDLSGEVEPNICKDFYANEDSTVWTIVLREGMKWSDGEPLTADDFIFYYDHCSTPALNDDRTAVSAEDEGYYSPFTSKAYNCFQVEKDGKKYWAEYEKVSDYEFTVTFAAPKPSFAVDFAVDAKWGVLPKHFYVNYVARKDGVTDDPTFPLITEDEALANANRDFGKQWDSYSTMGKSIGYYNWDYAIVPQLRSFIAVKDNWDTVGETYRLVRNPYFWKTDEEGRQLPYLDEIDVKIINEESQVTLQAMSGEFDIYLAGKDYSTVATEVQDTHDVVPWITASWLSGDSPASEGLELNQTVKDLDKRALFQDVRFREALSICVDRDLLNETLMNGMSEPWQASAPGADESWSKKWTEYDVDRANELMDELTEAWDRTPDTYRKMKGTNKEVEIIVSVREASESSDFLALLQSAYKKIGVRLSTKIDADFRTTMLSNDVEACVEMVSASTPAIRPDSIVPVRNVMVWFSAYGKWYEDGKTEANGGIEPTGDMRALIDAYDRMTAASGPDRQDIVDQCVQEIYDLHEKNIWIIGYLKPLPERFVVNKNLKNFKEGLMYVDEYRFEGLAHPEQFWMAE
ncbi:MAG: ABC transporter substrate-binding protein [Butyricicoccus sp.]